MGVASLWRYAVCLSHAEGHPAVTDPRSPPPLDGKNRQSPIACDFGSRTQIAALFAILLYPNVYNESPIARFESQFQIAGTLAIRIACF